MPAFAAPISTPTDNGRHIPLVLDLAVWDRLINALARSRIADLLDLVSDGAVLPLPPGTLVAVEEDYATRLHVRVLAGPSAGRSGWLPSGALGPTYLQRRAA